MKTTKKIYKTPETEVTHVEIESSICGGSVEFGGDKDKDPSKSVLINEQGVNSTFNENNNNDFSSTAWDMAQGS